VLAGLRRDPLAFLESLKRTYGDVIRLNFWLSQVYVVWQPDHVKHVLQDRHASYAKDNVDYRVLKRMIGNGLATNNGESWLRQRRLMQPAFNRASIGALGALVVDRTRARLRAWERAAERSMPVDVQREMKRISLDVVTRALFGVNVGKDARAVTRAFTTLSETLGAHLYSPFFFFFLLPGVPTRGNLRARAALKTLDRVVGSIIAARRARSGDAADDLLTRLLHARDDEGGGEGMDDRQVRDEVITLLLAGHETTAMALSWSWYLLDRHPEIAARVRAEIIDTVGDRDPTVADLPRLGCVTRVIEEAMRLYPPAWMITRVAKEADEIGGYRVPPKTVVMLSPYVTHRAPEVWPQPERFDPDRFTAERAADRPRFAYFPYAGGPRQCIGSDFAMLEAILVLATIARRYRLELLPGREVVPQALITLGPRGGLPMVPRPV
jgi:cytochrome P450